MTKYELGLAVLVAFIFIGLAFAYIDANATIEPPDHDDDPLPTTRKVEYFAAPMEESINIPFRPQTIQQRRMLARAANDPTY